MKEDEWNCPYSYPIISLRLKNTNDCPVALFVACNESKIVSAIPLPTRQGTAHDAIVRPVCEFGSRLIQYQSEINGHILNIIWSKFTEKNPSTFKEAFEMIFWDIDKNGNEYFLKTAYDFILDRCWNDYFETGERFKKDDYLEIPNLENLTVGNYRTGLRTTYNILRNIVLAFKEFHNRYPSPWEVSRYISFVKIITYNMGALPSEISIPIRDFIMRYDGVRSFFQMDENGDLSFTESCLDSGMSRLKDELDRLRISRLTAEQFAQDRHCPALPVLQKIVQMWSGIFIVAYKNVYDRFPQKSDNPTPSES